MCDRWHDYKLDTGQHPKYPWWRKDGPLGWERCDGRKVTWQPAHSGNATLLWHRNTGQREGVRRYDINAVQAIEYIDREDPLPPPPPRLGQRWVWLTNVAADGTPEQGCVDSVSPMVTGRWLVAVGERYCSNRPVAEEREYPWPPPGAVCAGPDDWWAPPESADE